MHWSHAVEFDWLTPRALWLRRVASPRRKATPLTRRKTATHLFRAVWSLQQHTMSVSGWLLSDKPSVSTYPGQSVTSTCSTGIATSLRVCSLCSSRLRVSRWRVSKPSRTTSSASSLPPVLVAPNCRDTSPRASRSSGQGLSLGIAGRQAWSARLPSAVESSTESSWSVKWEDRPDKAPWSMAWVTDWARLLSSRVDSSGPRTTFMNGNKMKIKKNPCKKVRNGTSLLKTLHEYRITCPARVPWKMRLEFWIKWYVIIEMLQSPETSSKHSAYKALRWVSGQFSLKIREFKKNLDKTTDREIICHSPLLLMRRSYVWHYSFICAMTHSHAPWLIHMCHDSFICAITYS